MTSKSEAMCIVSLSLSSRRTARTGCVPVFLVSSAFSRSYISATRGVINQSHSTRPEARAKRANRERNGRAAAIFLQSPVSSCRTARQRALRETLVASSTPPIDARDRQAFKFLHDAVFDARLGVATAHAPLPASTGLRGLRTSARTTTGLATLFIVQMTACAKICGSRRYPATARSAVDYTTRA